MQWGERTKSRKTKPGPGGAKPTWWILSWADGPPFSLLGWDEGAPGRDPSGIQGGFSAVWATVGVLRAGAPISPKEGHVSMGYQRKRGCNPVGAVHRGVSGARGLRTL